MILRPARKAAEYFKQKDPDTAITESFIRSLIKTGEIPTVKNGCKALIDVESLENYLSEKLRG